VCVCVRVCVCVLCLTDELYLFDTKCSSQSMARWDFRDRNVISSAHWSVINSSTIHSHYYLSKRVEDSSNGEGR